MNNITLTKLSENDFHSKMKRFPSFELSYETISHKKISPDYTLAVCVPNSKKYYAWFSYDTLKSKSLNVCYVTELNRDKKITNISTFQYNVSDDDNIQKFTQLSLGTIVYGSLYEESSSENPSKPESKLFFLIEDIYYYQGIKLTNISFGIKLGYIHEIMKQIDKVLFYQARIDNHLSKLNNTNNNYILFALPVMWKVSGEQKCNYESVSYHIHHIQYRKLDEIAPYLNVFMNRKIIPEQTHDNVKLKINDTTNNANTPRNIPKQIYNNNQPFCINSYKPQYKNISIFHVLADIQYDIYHLYALGNNNTFVYYQIAYIPNLKISIFMNGLFRNIRENQNIDLIEESDDDDDFENTTEDKYVDLTKSYLIECSFHTKFKKWVPIRVIESNKYNLTKIVHISKLVDGI